MKIRNFSIVTAISAVMFLSIPSSAQPIWFGSDVHNHWDNHTTYPGYNNLNNFMSMISTEYGAAFIGLVGDHSRKNIDGGTTADRAKDYAEVKTKVNQYFPSTSLPDYAKVYTRGNNDPSPNFSSTTGPCKSNSPFDTMYVINYNDFTTSRAVSLGTWLRALENAHKGKLVTIMSHYPLHSKKSDIDQGAAKAIFDTLNNHGQLSKSVNALDIVFIYGHTHGSQSGVPYDSKIKPDAPPSIVTTANHYMLEGDNMSNYNSAIHHDNVKKALWFTYVNAGYVGDPDVSGATGNMTAIWTGVDWRDYFCATRFAANGTWTEIIVNRIDQYRWSW